MKYENMLCLDFSVNYQKDTYICMHIFSSITQSCLTVVHGLQHHGLLCPSPTPRPYSNSCPLSQWCHPTISFTVVLFSSCLQSFPASASFPVSQLFTWGGQKYWSFSFSNSLLDECSRLIPFRIDGFDLLAVQETLKSLLQPHSSKASIFWCSVLFIVQLSHLFITTGETITLSRQTFVGKVTSLFLNMLSRLSLLFFQGANVF